MVDTNPRYLQRNDDDFRIEFFSGTGKGGQKRNKSQSCCRVIHIPTGLMEVRQGRSRESNQKDATDSLILALNAAINKDKHKKLSSDKKQQIGTGMRGDKIRTYRFQDDMVVDHQTGRKTKCSKVMKGRFDLLW